MAKIITGKSCRIIGATKGARYPRLNLPVAFADDIGKLFIVERDAKGLIILRPVK